MTFLREKMGLTCSQTGFVQIRISFIADLSTKEDHGIHTCCLPPVTVNHLSLPEVIHQCSESPTLLLIQGLCLWVHSLSPALSISPSLRLFPSTSKCTNYILNPISSHSLFPALSYHHLTFGLHELLTGLFVSPFYPNSVSSTQQPG